MDEFKGQINWMGTMQQQFLLAFATLLPRQLVALSN